MATAVPAAERPPTDRQLDVMRAVAAHQRRRGAPPTIRWVQEWFGIASPNGVMCNYLPLVRRGLMEAAGEGATAARYRLTDAGWRALGLIPPGELEALLLAYRSGQDAERLDGEVDRHLAACRGLPDVGE